jgi:beta-N-acetylhexosaminidase
METMYTLPYGLLSKNKMKQKLFWILTVILTSGFLLTSCSDNNDNEKESYDDDEVEAQLKQMALREKVGQMFYVRPEVLDTTIHYGHTGGIDVTIADLANIKLQAVNATMLAVNEKYPVGGIILYAHNIGNEAQLAAFIPQLRALKGSPLLCIDEEGGRVARIGNNPNFNVKKFESMDSIGKTGDPANAYYCGNTIGTYLKKYGFDIDFAPVADVNTNPENIVIGKRAFSDDPSVAAPMVTNYLQGLKDAGITGCIKHFPGHGDTKSDTHYGYAQSLKTWDEMMNCEMITFRAGIEWGCQLIMTAHIATPNVTGTDLPATMSSLILQDKLRGLMGYKNIIITDDMEMGAITQQFTSAEAAVGCILAGADIVLGPQNFIEAFEAVVKAVEKGIITEERINQSVRRILKLKIEKGYR